MSHKNPRISPFLNCACVFCAEILFNHSNPEDKRNKRRKVICRQVKGCTKSIQVSQCVDDDHKYKYKYNKNKG